MADELPAKRPGPQPPRTKLGLAVFAAWTFGGTAAVGLTFLLTYLVFGVSPTERLPPANESTLLDVIRIALAVVAGMGGVVALVVAYRRQKHLEKDEAGQREHEAGERDRERAYRDRYSSAAQQLGNEQAAVRMAGAYAMANLADEWNDQRQQCVDVLCAYLRLPWYDDPDSPHEASVTSTEQSWADGEGQRRVQRTYSGRAGEREVRRTIVKVIADHLREGGSTSWSSLNFDLRRAHLPEARFHGARFFGHTTSFTDAHFSGAVTSFSGASFTGGDTSFQNATFAARATYFEQSSFTSSKVRFNRSTFSGEVADFDNASFLAGEVTFEKVNFGTQVTTFSATQFNSDFVNFDDSVFNCDTTNFNSARFETAWTHFRRARFNGETAFSGATFVGDTALFTDAIFAGSYLNFAALVAEASCFFDGAHFLVGHVDFRDAKFSGEQANFSRAEFHGRYLELLGTEFHSPETDFSMALLPARWRFDSCKVPPSDKALTGARFEDVGTLDTDTTTG